jgi:hypothetical protein
MIGLRGLNAHKVVASGRGIERHSGSRGTCAIGSDSQRRVVLRGAEYSLIRATLSAVNGPRVHTARRCVSECHRHFRGSPLRPRCHGRRSVHLHGTCKLRWTGDTRVPAAVESHVRGALLDGRLRLKRAAGAERERCAYESKGSKACHRYSNDVDLHEVLHSSRPGSTPARYAPIHPRSVRLRTVAAKGAAAVTLAFARRRHRSGP